MPRPKPACFTHSARSGSAIRPLAHNRPASVQSGQILSLGGEGMQAPAPIRIMIVDDHHVVRLGLIAIFKLFSNFEVVGEAASQQEAVNRVRQCRPDVVLMDVRLSDGDGIEACRTIKEHHPAIRVVMLTSYSDE